MPKGLPLECRKGFPLNGYCPSGVVDYLPYHTTTNIASRLLFPSCFLGRTQFLLALRSPTAAPAWGTKVTYRFPHRSAIRRNMLTSLRDRRRLTRRSVRPLTPPTPPRARLNDVPPPLPPGDRNIASDVRQRHRRSGVRGRGLLLRRRLQRLRGPRLPRPGRAPGRVLHARDRRVRRLLRELGSGPLHHPVPSQQ